MLQKLSFIIYQRLSFLISQKRNILISQKGIFLISQKFRLIKQFVSNSEFYNTRHVIATAEKRSRDQNHVRHKKN